MKNIIIIVLALFGLSLLLRDCYCRKPAASVKSDTLYVTKWKPVHDTIFIDTPHLVKSEPAKKIPPQYIADTNYPALRLQYDNLLNKYLTTNTYRDTAKKDSIIFYGSHIVRENKLLSSTYSFTGFFPETTVTITNNITGPPARQLYVGLELGTSFKLDELQAAIGVMYKNRRDQVITGKIGATHTGQLFGTIGTYRKINFKRKAD